MPAGVGVKFEGEHASRGYKFYSLFEEEANYAASSRSSSGLREADSSLRRRLVRVLRVPLRVYVWLCECCARWRAEKKEQEEEEESNGGGGGDGDDGDDECGVVAVVYMAPAAACSAS